MYTAIQILLALAFLVVFGLSLPHIPHDLAFAGIAILVGQVLLSFSRPSRR